MIVAVVVVVVDVDVVDVVVVVVDVVVVVVVRVEGGRETKFKINHKLHDLLKVTSLE